jgi:hypothetical protein
MNVFHLILILLVIGLHLAAYIDMTKKERVSREGLITIASCIIFCSLIILSALWH